MVSTPPLILRNWPLVRVLYSTGYGASFLRCTGLLACADGPSSSEEEVAQSFAARGPSIDVAMRGARPADLTA